MIINGTATTYLFEEAHAAALHVTCSAAAGKPAHATATHHRPGSCCFMLHTAPISLILSGQAAETTLLPLRGGGTLRLSGGIG